MPRCPRWLAVGVVAGWSLAAGVAGGQGLERTVPPGMSEEAPAAQTSQEQFLQQFISRSLARSSAPEAPKVDVAAPGRDVPAARDGTGVGREGGTSVGQALPPLMGTVTTVVGALGATLGCLLGGTYLVRRFLLPRTRFGKRTNPLQVLTTVYITPKAAVTLLEVPGKLLVVGVTGSTLVPLGEVLLDTPTRSRLTNEPQRMAFTTILDQSLQELRRVSESALPTETAAMAADSAAAPAHQPAERAHTGQPGALTLEHLVRELQQFSRTETQGEREPETAKSSGQAHPHVPETSRREASESVRLAQLVRELQKLSGAEARPDKGIDTLERLVRELRRASGTDTAGEPDAPVGEPPVLERRPGTAAASAPAATAAPSGQSAAATAPPDQVEHALLYVSQQIQRKLSQLKQL